MKGYLFATVVTGEPQVHFPKCTHVTLNFKKFREGGPQISNPMFKFPSPSGNNWLSDLRNYVAKKWTKHQHRYIVAISQLAGGGGRLTDYEVGESDTEMMSEN